ncbi:ATP-binding cassette domain-containing protein [Variovorax paradoxus]|nr:ATP-binding cassette domain-containing protein [Variovorax paradoxus]UKI08255.1 ATP-binding cassette domain-containing protein [Variovorax paradoxus]
MTTLNVRDIRGGYGSADEIVKGIDLEVRARDLAVIIGPNGAGKSTFLKLVAGLLKPKTGHVQIDGRHLLSGSAQEACAQGLSFVPQERNVFQSLTVRRTSRWEATWCVRRPGRESRRSSNASRCSSRA